MKSRYRIAITVLLVLVAAGVALWPRSKDTTATVEHEFVVEEDFARVRKILVRTNAVKKIVAMSNSEFIDQEWLQISLDLKQLLIDPEWSVSGDGTLSVRTTDPYVGENEVTLHQKVEVRSDQLSVTNELVEPVAKLRGYDTSMRVAPESEQSRFRATLTLTVATKVSPIFRTIAQRRVRQAAETALRQQETAIRKVIEQHKNDLIILPDFRS